ncbi:hypothetical protein [Paenibacillus dendritiformis]|uniref:hypothetical protein n=1 Tax=Paenibacillus dendritiformis TaxID=130049 RepID=UPI000DA9DC59|nr:hypothetical protein [Paenibacillus dendritiformis]PZM64834.1 hypothetical protein DOE73_14845 [Paenibacillus dendritiformis]
MENVKDILKSAEKLRDIIATAPRQFDENDRKIEQFDKESGDLLHAVELLTYDDEQAAQYIEEIRKNRRSRRLRKDQNMVLKPLVDYIRSRPKLLQELRDVCRETEKAAKVLEERSYHPRIRMELAAAFAQQAAAKGGEGDGEASESIGGSADDGRPAS